jgi:NAD(P)-dependent dehydrogenase (short-subunit alcohol dehydrogenase family)
VLASVRVARVPLALITGASTGIGEATALRLARGGWTVLAGVRGAEAAERLKASAASAGASGNGAGTGGVLPITLDVTDAGQVAAAAARVDEESRNGSGSGGLDALVNNAGIGVGGPLELAELDELRRQMEVNFIAPIAVMQALLPALRRARGRIVFVSSVGGKVSTPFIAPYAASKHAIEAVGDALRVELGTSKVRVALVEPGSVATPIWDKALEDTARRGVPPDQVADAIERALTDRRMKARYLVGRDARVQLLLRRLLPDHAFDRLIRRLLGV